MKAAADEFAISRTLNASPERVWQAFTQADQLGQWWGPHMIRCAEVKLDLRVGGTYRIVQELDGQTYPLKGEFRELAAPQPGTPGKLVMTLDCSEHPPEWHDAVQPARGGNANPAGIMVLTARFEPAAGGKTVLSLLCRFESARIRDIMVPLGMNKGWNESFEKLDGLLSGKAARTISASQPSD